MGWLTEYDNLVARCIIEKIQVIKDTRRKYAHYLYSRRYTVTANGPRY